MSKVRIVAIAVAQKFYVGDTSELEVLIDKGYEIVTATFTGDHILYTMVRR